MTNFITGPIKDKVSKQKIRFTEDGFNLDLTYITPNVIAMGYPAEMAHERMFRNTMSDVVRFLNSRHTSGTCGYKVYNLCSEKTYDSAKFMDYSYFPFKDHNPPTIKLIADFCRDMKEFLGSRPDRVAAVHCKAGKGRTGTMICCYLLHVGLYKSAEEVLQFYGNKRTRDGKGVTIPSQRRYVGYYARLLNENLKYEPRRLRLVKLKLVNMPREFCPLGKCSIAWDEGKEYREVTCTSANTSGHAAGGIGGGGGAHGGIGGGGSSSSNNSSSGSNNTGAGGGSGGGGQGGIGTTSGGSNSVDDERNVTLRLTEDPNAPLTVWGDVVLQFGGRRGWKREKFHCWFNTFFVDLDLQKAMNTTGNNKDSSDGTFSMVLPLNEIDEAFKHYKSSTDFKIEIVFRPDGDETQHVLNNRYLNNNNNSLCCPATVVTTAAPPAATTGPGVVGHFTEKRELSQQVAASLHSVHLAQQHPLSPATNHSAGLITGWNGGVGGMGHGPVSSPISPVNHHQQQQQQPQFQPQQNHHKFQTQQQQQPRSNHNGWHHGNGNGNNNNNNSNNNNCSSTGEQVSESNQDPDVVNRTLPGSESSETSSSESTTTDEDGWESDVVKCSGNPQLAATLAADHSEQHHRHHPPPHVRKGKAKRPESCGAAIVVAGDVDRAGENMMPVDCSLEKSMDGGTVETSSSSAVVAVSFGHAEADLSGVMRQMSNESALDAVEMRSQSSDESIEIVVVVAGEAKTTTTTGGTGVGEEELEQQQQVDGEDDSGFRLKFEGENGEEEEVEGKGVKIGSRILEEETMTGKAVLTTTMATRNSGDTCPEERGSSKQRTTMC